MLRPNPEVEKNDLIYLDSPSMIYKETRERVVVVDLQYKYTTQILYRKNVWHEIYTLLLHRWRGFFALSSLTPFFYGPKRSEWA